MTSMQKVGWIFYYPICAVVGVSFGMYTSSLLWPTYTKPKPAPIPVNWHVGNIETHWLRCNAGLEVTNLADCPEAKRVLDCNPPGEYQLGCPEATSLIEAAREAVTPKLRKHKAKSGGIVWSDKLTFESLPWEEWHFVSIPSSDVYCKRERKTSRVECQSRPLTVEEVKLYNTPIDLYPNSVTDSPIKVPDCAHPGDEGCKLAWPVILSTQIQVTEEQKNAYPSNAWMKPCGPDNHADGCYVPDPPACKLPSDIDVCHVQMLDKKERHD